MPNSSSRTHKKLLRELGVKLETDSGTQLGSYWRRHGASDDQLERLDEYVTSFGNRPFEPDPWKIVMAITGNAEPDRDDFDGLWEAWGCNPNPSEHFVVAFVEAALDEDRVIDD